MMNTDVKHRKLHDSEKEIKVKSGESYFHQPAGLMLVISSVRTWNLMIAILFSEYRSVFKTLPKYL